jgi:hypothetical protein
MRLCKVLIDRFHPLRTPMPLVALRAVAEPDRPAADDEVRKGVEFLREMHLRRGLRCRVVEAAQDGDDFHRGLAVLRDLAGKPWESRHRPHSETYVFPRSGLLEAIEQAVSADDEHTVLARLERMRWRPRPAGDGTGGWALQALRAATTPANLVGAAVVATLGGVAATQGLLVLGVLAGRRAAALARTGRPLDVDHHVPGRRQQLRAGLVDLAAPSVPGHPGDSRERGRADLPAGGRRARRP